MGPSLPLDHVVVVVASLESVTRLFRDAGFTVTPGGRHDALRTENALIGFADGSYLELLATQEPSDRDELRALAKDVAEWERHLRGVSAIARRFLPSLARPDGVADWCLCAARLEPLAARLRSEGCPAAGPVPMGRKRRDGEKLAWELLLPESRVHPFWIRDETPRDRRVPGSPEAIHHENGSRGIRSVRLCATDLGLSALALGSRLGRMPQARPDGSSILAMGEWQVELVAGEPEGACGAALAGCASLPDGIRALGIQPATGV